MKNFKCVYFQTDAGRIPVKEFIDSLHDRTQQKYFNVIDLLEEHGKSLPSPHADHLGDGIYELRFIGIEGKIRIFYFFYDGSKIVLTNGFIKKTQKTPAQELELARRRKRIYEQSYE